MEKGHRPKVKVGSHIRILFYEYHHRITALINKVKAKITSWPRGGGGGGQQKFKLCFTTSGKKSGGLATLSNCVQSNTDSSNPVGKLDVSGNAEFECKIN